MGKFRTIVFMVGGVLGFGFIAIGLQIFLQEDAIGGLFACLVGILIMSTLIVGRYR